MYAPRPHRATPIVSLIAICVAVAATAIGWKAWDMFTPARRPMLQGWNDSFYYFWLPAVIINHDVDFAGPMAISGTMTAEARAAGLGQERTATGLIPNKYPPGWALGSLPFFLAAHLLSGPGASGFEPSYLVAVWIGQEIYAIIGLWLAISIVRRLLPAAPAAFAVLSVWLASPLVYYQSARLSLSHSQLFTLAMAVFWLALRIANGDDRRRTWLVLGFCSAMLVVTRNIAGVYLLFPLVVIGPRCASPRALIYLVVGGLVPVAVQMAAWKLVFGSWLAYSYGTERFDFSQIHLLDVLFSARHGLFYWHPVMLVGFGGLVWALRSRQLAWPWIVSFGVVTVLNAAWPCWWFASSFGNRGFEVGVFFAMFGVAALLDAVRDRPRWHRLLTATLAGACVWNVLLLAVFLTRRIPNEDAVTYADSIRAMVTWTRALFPPEFASHF